VLDQVLGMAGRPTHLLNMPVKRMVNRCESYSNMNVTRYIGTCAWLPGDVAVHTGVHSNGRPSVT
jgi:hypothetical protein